MRCEFLSRSARPTVPLVLLLSLLVALSSSPTPAFSPSRPSGLVAPVGGAAATVHLLSSALPQRLATPAAAPAPDDWPTYEADAARTGYNPGESTLDAADASNLTLLWSFAPGGPAEGSPIEVNGTLYVGAWNGYEYALNASNGSVEWKRYLGETVDAGCAWLSPIGITSTATYLNGTLYVAGGGSRVFALNATDGRVLWQYYAGANATTGGGIYLWASPLLYDGYLYMGIASECDNPLVQGELLQLYASNGSLDHTFYVVGSATNAQTGGSIWSTPAVDASRNVVWITTGNEDSATGYSRAVVALNATTLALLGYWQQPYGGYDYDFGAGPTLFHDATGTPLVGAMNKDGYTYVFNRTNVSASGSWKPLWVDRTTNFTPFVHPTADAISPAAFDGSRLFVGGGNSSINGTTVEGSVRALDPATGAFLWQEGTPGVVRGGLSAADGLVVVPVAGETWSSQAGRYFSNNNSTLEVLDATTGQLRFQYPIPYSANSPAIVAGGRIFVGAGSANLTGWDSYPGPTGAVYAFGLPMVASARATPTSGVAPLAVSFTGTVSGGRPPYAPDWSFGDGTTTSGWNVTHTYSSAGSYTARLTVTDAANNSSSTTVLIEVRSPLLASVSASPASGGAPLNVTLVASATGGTPPYSYLWDFGDGATGAGGAVVQHLYAQPGSYSASLRVADVSGDNSSARANITVLAVTPLAVQVQANATAGPAPLPVAFTSDVTGGSSPYTYLWDFGDGGSSAAASPDHTFGSAGLYTVSLTVSDSALRTSGATIDVTVSSPATRAPPAPSVSVALDSEKGACSPPTVTATLTATAVGGSPPYSFTWQGDGLAPGTAGENVTVEISGSGNHTLGATVTDTKGVTNTTWFTVPFTPPPCAVPAPTLGVGGLVYVLLGALVTAVAGITVLVVHGRRRSTGAAGRAGR